MLHLGSRRVRQRRCHAAELDGDLLFSPGALPIGDADGNSNTDGTESNGDGHVNDNTTAYAFADTVRATIYAITYAKNDAHAENYTDPSNPSYSTAASVVFSYEKQTHSPIRLP
jgi:hypothetical protein